MYYKYELNFKKFKNGNIYTYVFETSSEETLLEEIKQYIKVEMYDKIDYFKEQDDSISVMRNGCKVGTIVLKAVVDKEFCKVTHYNYILF